MSVELPANYVETHPRRGPWRPVSELPQPLETVEVVLADGSTEPAVWTGEVWWRLRKLEPVAWRRIPDVQMTAK